MPSSCVFLIGGTGNQLFQLVNNPDCDLVDDLFVKSSVRKMLGQTDHDNLLVDLLQLKANGAFLNRALLFFDLLLGKLFGVSLFSILDLKKVRATPLFKPLNRLGYFQDTVDENSQWLHRLKRALVDATIATDHHYTTVVHFRGGDFLVQGGNEFGNLDCDYYLRSLRNLNINQSEPLLVLTNDVPSARKALEPLNSDGFELDIRTTSLLETMCVIVRSEKYVSSNSTLSYFLCLIRGEDAVTAIPDPYSKREGLPLPSYGSRVPANYS